MALALGIVALALGHAAAQPAAVTPNDPLYVAHQQYLGAVHAPEAWAAQTGDPSVTIAVLDSGIDLAHPDLAANIWTNPNAGATGCGDDEHGCSEIDPAHAAKSCALTEPFATPDVVPLTPQGTFLAGVIAAAGNNGVGITGVMWRAGIMAVRVSDCRGGADESALAAGIRYAAAAGAKVILIGPGGKRTLASGGCKPPLALLAQAVQDARDAGALVIAGAGNDNAGCVDDPAAAPGALAVAGANAAATARWLAQDGKTGSNYGPQVAVAAPAEDIAGTIPLQPKRKPPDDRYAIASGDDGAAAIVAGEAGLLLSQNPLLTPDWLTELITSSAHPLPDGGAPGWDGAGLVDLAAALRLVPAAFAGSVTLDGAPAPDGTLVEAYVDGNLCAQASTFSQNGVSTYALFVPAEAMQPGCGAPGQTVELRVAGFVAADAAWISSATALDLDAVSVGG